MRSLIMNRYTRPVVIAILLLTGTIGLTACTDEGPTAQEREATSRNGSYKSLVAGQPAESMDYSPSRETINGWIKTWREPGKLSYVYLQSADGTLLGYYILKGLPVSYCAGLTPPYEFVNGYGGDSISPDAQVPAPGVDGVYYSGGQCNTYYGFDATSGSYIEYTAGLGINVLLFEQPLPRQESGEVEVLPLGDAEVGNVPAP